MECMYICARYLQELSARFPGRVHLVRFEDLSLSPELTVARLLAFLGLAWTQRLDHFIRTHTATDTVEAGAGRRRTSAVNN